MGALYLYLYIYLTSKIKAMFYGLNRLFIISYTSDICSDGRAMRVPGRDRGTVFWLIPTAIQGLSRTAKLTNYTNISPN